MFIAIGTLMIVAGVIVAGNFLGAARRMAESLAHRVQDDDVTVGKMRLVGMVWIVVGAIAVAFMSLKM